MIDMNLGKKKSYKKIKIKKMYLPTPYKLQYSTESFPFKEKIISILDEQDLEYIHLRDKIDVLSRDKDQYTKWHKKYYDSFKDVISPLYVSLVDHLKNVFEYEEVIYQKIPTFRIHQVGNLGVGEWHKDKSYNHGTSEVNFWLPFTDTYETNTIWSESKEDLGDYQPYDVKYGEILVFSGANLMHGNKINTTNHTRVSMDFRLVDPKRFSPNQEGSINMKTPFDIGGYFEKI
jgi:hypothetical protein